MTREDSAKGEKPRTSDGNPKIPQGDNLRQLQTAADSIKRTSYAKALLNLWQESLK